MTQQNVGSKRTASSTAGTIAAKSQETAEQMKEAVVDQVNQVRDKAQSAKDHTTSRIRGVATQLRGVGDTLRQDDPLVAGLADRASDGIESLARYVGSATPQSFVRDTENLARRQPALFFGGAFLLGLAAGRFLKSSAPVGSHSSGASGWRGYGSDEDDGSYENRERRPSGFFPNNESPVADRNTRSNYRFQENYDATFGRDSIAPGTSSVPQTSGSMTSGSQSSGSQTSGSQTSGRGNSP